MINEAGPAVEAGAADAGKALRAQGAGDHLRH